MIVNTLHKNDDDDDDNNNNNNNNNNRQWKSEGLHNLFHSLEIIGTPVATTYGLLCAYICVYVLQVAE